MKQKIIVTKSDDPLKETSIEEVTQGLVKKLGKGVTIEHKSFSSEKDKKGTLVQFFTAKAPTLTVNKKTLPREIEIELYAAKNDDEKILHSLFQGAVSKK